MWKPRYTFVVLLTLVVMFAHGALKSAGSTIFGLLVIFGLVAWVITGLRRAADPTKFCVHCRSLLGIAKRGGGVGGRNLYATVCRRCGREQPTG